MINWLDFKSVKRRVTLESVLLHYQVKLRRSGKTNIGDAARFTVVTAVTPFT